MRLALCLWLLLNSLFFVAARSPLASLDEVSPRPRRAFRELSPTALDALTTLDRSSEGFIDPAVKDGALKAILIPRVAGTDGNLFVQKYLTNIFSELKWDIETDRFTDSTPYGDREFTNLVFTFDKDAPRRIVLAAHFDSKFFPAAPDNEFVGATDSAFPITMLCSLATTLTPLLEARRKRLQAAADAGGWVEVGPDGFDEQEAGDTTIQIVFFDGEEAFKQWTDTDSTYGARHLAQKWSETYPEPPAADSYHFDSRHRFSRTANVLEQMDALVLLDLLGAANPTISSFYPTTGWMFDQLRDIERRLGAAGRFASLGEASWTADEKTSLGRSWFRARDTSGRTWIGGGISDDHLPFLQRGVEILHVIAAPFPQVWHTIKDDASALHVPSCKRWDLIFKVWAAEYLGLVPELPAAVQARGEDGVAPPKLMQPTPTTGSRKVERSGDL